jgi:hypothetical protein
MLFRMGFSRPSLAGGLLVTSREIVNEAGFLRFSAVSNGRAGSAISLYGCAIVP